VVVDVATPGERLVADPEPPFGGTIPKFVEIIGENARGPQPLNDRQVVD